MKRLVCAVSVCGFAAALLVRPLVAQGEKPPEIKEIMGKVNKGPSCLQATLGKQLNAGSPAWDDIQRETKDYAKLAAALGQNDPPKGDRNSWTKLTKSYAETARSLDDAAQKKDLEGAKTAHGTLKNSCMACHRAHRGKA
jgi:cytochrome c556